MRNHPSMQHTLQRIFILYNFWLRAQHFPDFQAQYNALFHNHQRRDKMRDRIEKLPDKQRTILLHVYDNKPNGGVYEETAADMLELAKNIIIHAKDESGESGESGASEQTSSPLDLIKREGWFKSDGGKSVKIGKVGAGGVLGNKNGYSKLEIGSHSTSLVQLFAEWLFNFGSLD
ncbi:hypothetical protein M0R45_006180 [Rubus argutus]|uniref:Uncharacterized protein n=1 Tax=Rubus argutus TaxID=59490 RepID=A0AAW1YPU3_RUBAR